MQLQNIERDFKSENLLRTCSVVSNMVTSLEFNSICFATMLCHFGQTRTVPWPLISIISAALRRAVIQAST